MSRVIGSRLALVAIAAGVCAASLAPAAANPVASTSKSEREPESELELELEPTVVAPGGSITFKGRHFGSNKKVTLLIGPPRSEGDRVGSARTNSKGRFRKAVRISASAQSGTYVGMACRRSCAIKATARFKITS